jgi:Methyltransferase domain
MSTDTSSNRVLPAPDRIDRRIASLPPRLRWAAGAMRLTLREPADGLDRVLVRARNSLGQDTQDACHYEADPNWHRHVHERLGIPWPCSAVDEFAPLWQEITAGVRARGVSLGRGMYGGWDDGDPGLARVIWCLTCHLAPATVVETGVARGVTSRVILEALERTGAGHLWSIDLPAMDPNLHDEIGVAVPERLHRRWTYTTGTSRRRLPKLLAEIGPIDLFVHDSSHTERNIVFELEQAWPAIGRGAIVADDIHQSRGFARFAARVPAGDTLVVDADDASAQFGVALKLR